MSSHKYVFDAVRRHDETTIIVTMRCLTCADTTAQEFPITAAGLGAVAVAPGGVVILEALSAGVSDELLDQIERTNSGAELN